MASVTKRTTTSRALFEVTRPLAALEHFRVPCHVVADDSAGSGWVESLRPVGGGPRLLWPSPAPGHRHAVAASLCQDDQIPIPVFTRVVGDFEAKSLLSDLGGSWTRSATRLETGDGHRLASIWSNEDGSLFLPFDPDEVRLNYLTERYQAVLADGHRGIRHHAMRSYYRARGLMPRPLQIWLRRRYARVQARTKFPRWPIETGLHDFLDFLLDSVRSLVEEPVPTIAPWPAPATWALVLTHDVEAGVGLAAMDGVLELERALGFRSSWNFVPRRDYELSRDRAEALESDGFEVGVHGLYHDGRDLESRAVLQERLPGMREAAARWNAAGFRSPATHRNWELMPLLGFDYDSSYPDTDPFEPMGGGCCSWLPFFNDGLVELPLTMSQDHTLFVILRQPDERAWVNKAEFLRSRGGMALMDTHPDYLIDEAAFGAYRRLLERFSGDADAWKALPSEVSDWWRRRAASKLERDGAAWQVVGPAAEEAWIDLGSHRLAA